MRATRLAALAALVAAGPVIGAAGARPIVATATVDGIIQPVTAEFMDRALVGHPTRDW